MDTRSFVLAFGMWQFVYFVAARLIARLLSHRAGAALVPDKAARAVLTQQAPAYLVSTLHALLVTGRGLQHLYYLLHAPVSVKLLRPLPAEAALLPPSAAPFVAEADRVLTTNVLLAAYLLSDLVHIARLYPAIGALDTVAHHAAFLACALVAGRYKLSPFMFSWLIIGEASTPLLNLRWLLIRIGRGDAPYFKAVEFSFAALFVLLRFFVYSVGLAYQVYIVDHVPECIPTWAVVSTMTFVGTGFVLNLTWLGKIYKLATGQGKRRRHAEDETTHRPVAEPQRQKAE